MWEMAYVRNVTEVDMAVCSISLLQVLQAKSQSVTYVVDRESARPVEVVAKSEQRIMELTV